MSLITAAPIRLVPVLAGGGTRLSAHVGVLQALADMNICYQHIVGVSGGSIVAALAALGWPPHALRKLAYEENFAQFKGLSLVSLLRDGGLSSGDSFERWIEDKSEGATFRDVPTELHIVATDVRSQSPVVFDREHTPDLKIARAVRFSMGIPLLFTFKPYAGKLLVDGSILAEDALRRDWAQDGSPAVYFRMRAQQARTVSARRPFFSLPSYLTMLIRTFMTSISREYVRDAYWSKTLLIETGDISPLEFGLSPLQKNLLFMAGYEQTMHYLPIKLGLSKTPLSAEYPALSLA